jgi:hypothetical protein
MSAFLNQTFPEPTLAELLSDPWRTASIHGSSRKCCAASRIYVPNLRITPTSRRRPRLRFLGSRPGAVQQHWKAANRMIEPRCCCCDA